MPVARSRIFNIYYVLIQRHMPLQRRSPLARSRMFNNIIQRHMPLQRHSPLARSRMFNIIIHVRACSIIHVPHAIRFRKGSLEFTRIH